MYQIGSGVLKLGDITEVPSDGDAPFDGKGIAEMQEIPSLTPVNIRMNKLGHIGYEEGLDLDPVYQRGHVWETKQESEFIGYLLKGGKCPPLWVNRYGNTEKGGKGWTYRPCSVIDGKQRITAMIRWVQGEIPALLYGREIWYRELNAVDRRCLPTIDVIYVNMTEREQMTLYLNLNGGVAHTPEELERVRDLLFVTTA